MTICKIFMVDDDAEDRAILKEAMEEANYGHLIRFACNGEEAMDLLSNYYIQKDLPCLIVLDLNMPRMNGIQTLRTLKNDNRFSHLPVVIYSTSINPSEKETCLLLGAKEYIGKPLTFVEAKQVVETLLSLCN